MTISTRAEQAAIEDAHRSTVPCPRCYEQCGWCADYRKMHGTMRLPGSRRKCTIPGFEPEGDNCPVCGGDDKVLRTVTYERLGQ